MSSTTPSPSKWRTLSADEFAASPDAKLRGVLAVIFWAAAALVAAVLLTLVTIIALGGLLPITMFVEVMFSAQAPGSALTIARLHAIQQALFVVWAFVFVVMTLARRPSTPSVASVLMVVWALSLIGAEVATQYLNVTRGFDPTGPLWALPLILLVIVLASAFCRYMSVGRRPNVYFRKRVRC
jgi:hypothetical protein